MKYDYDMNKMMRINANYGGGVKEEEEDNEKWYEEMGCKMRARMRKIMMVMTRVKTTMRMMVSAPSELLFFTLKESGEVGFISLTGAQSHDLTLAGRSSHPSAVTYDPIEQVYLPDRA